MARISALLILGWTCFLCARVEGADYWVAPNGRDSQVRGARTQPWKSLQHAAGQVRQGDTVHILDGDYSGFDLRHGGTQRAPINFKAEGKRVRIVRQNPKTPDGINLEGADDVIIDGFVINEMPRAGVGVVSGSRVIVRNVRSARSGWWGIFTAHCNDVSVIGNRVSGSVKEHGIYISNSGDRPVVRGNVLWRNARCGLHMNGDLSQGGDGIISHAVVENNIIFDNGAGGGSGINCDGVQLSRITNNLLYDNHASGISLYRIDAAGSSLNNQVINNTIVQAESARSAINVLNKSTGNIIANNIFLHKGSQSGINVSADSFAGLRSDHNIVSGFSREEADGVLNLREWQALTGLDPHSTVSTIQDLFLSPESNDYHLRRNNLAIDTADAKLAPDEDLDGRIRSENGRGPDIGAYESR